MIAVLLMAAAALPEVTECQGVTQDPAATIAFSTGLQGFIYGYPVVDMLKQMHNETHRVNADQPVVAPINQIVPYPHILTPDTQGQLRAPNADTLYLNAWVDLSKGPVLLDVPAMGARYYTLAFMDLFAKPHHLGTRTNGGKPMKYSLVGPAGGTVPEGYEAFPLPTDTAWMLGRILADGKADEARASMIAKSFRMVSPSTGAVETAEPIRPYDSLQYFTLLNGALHNLKLPADEAALADTFNAAGFGPAVAFDAAKLTPAQRLGLGCAVRLGPGVLAKQGFRPTHMANGWMRNSKIADPGHDYLLRAESVRGGYVNAQEEAIYPAAIMDNRGEMLTGKRSYRIRFAAGKLPPVDAFWSVTAYDLATAKLVPNSIGRYQFGDRTKGAKYGKDGSLTIALSATQPKEGKSNWLPVPAGPFHLVTRMYLPRAEALDGRYVLPPVERIDQ